MELQDLLIDRFVEHRQATAAGQEWKTAWKSDPAIGVISAE